ncbi:nucleotide exchange factor GrpE [Candidatus Nomurabacteria bacterium RIFCSPLOWO2_01_FULL_36_10b]|uniref:Protein GrpE n=1 Tax=Candidatus Nomurabacteria bacterium RIFCSPLOWO2_01_FULL_36_10b TaxID=1801766 RepID=A0A1F6WNU7_9BACT|nr:MAG: nucleotide exchange factor GrpE [Candidatus Nomurabacteria bacterium RIFCSPLOWO2_01_FULL_36_10b]
MKKKDSQNNNNNNINDNDGEFVQDEEFINEGASVDKIKKLQHEIKEVKKLRDEYLAGWQGAKADYINLKREHEKSLSKLRENVQIDCIEDLLPVLDSFEMAMKNKEAWGKVDKNWRDGIEYIYQQFLSILGKYNVTIISETGAPFNPRYHEPIETEKASQESSPLSVAQTEDNYDSVVAIIQSGYRIGDMVIRPAKVKVRKYQE